MALAPQIWAQSPQRVQAASLTSRGREVSRLRARLAHRRRESRSCGASARARARTPRSGTIWVALEAVGLVEVDQAAALGGGQRVDGAALVDVRSASAASSATGVAGGEQRVHGARRAAARPLALHGDDRVDDGEARRQGEVQVEQHVGEVGAFAAPHVELALAQAGDAAEGELDAPGQAHEPVGLQRSDLDDAVGLVASSGRRGSCERGGLRERRAPPSRSGVRELDALVAADAAMPLTS